MSKKKIYIAGKISGEDPTKCAGKFLKAENEIEFQGFEAINPLKIVGTWDTTWEDAMRKCIAALMTADAILLLPDWADSRGARIEQDIAFRVKIRLLVSTRDLQKRVK